VDGTDEEKRVGRLINESFKKPKFSSLVWSLLRLKMRKVEYNI
jgi:hypothetical protein